MLFRVMIPLVFLTACILSGVADAEPPATKPEHPAITVYMSPDFKPERDVIIICKYHSSEHVMVCMDIYEFTSRTGMTLRPAPTTPSVPKLKSKITPIKESVPG